MTDAIDAAFVARARTAAETIAPLAARIETERRLPAEAVDALAATGVFKLLVPRALGGSDAHPATMLAMIEELAHADGSAGWCAMIGASSGLMSRYLDTAIAGEVFGPADAIACGVYAPLGRAVPTERGYRVAGRWPFASGCQHSRWRMVGTFTACDPPERLASGAPDVRCVLMRADETIVHDTWDTAGLRGTGSHDLEVADVEVPRERTFSMLRPRDDVPPWFGVLAAGVAATGIGIARAALDGFVAGATRGKGAVAQRGHVQIELARAEGKLLAARAGLYAMLDAAVRSPLDPVARARLRLAACQAATEAAHVAGVAFELGGGAAIYAKHPLQRQFRDAQVVTHHVMVSSTALVTPGRVLLGLDTETATL